MRAPGAGLLLLRARLHLAHEDPAAALADCDRAEELEPDLAAIGRCRALILLAQSQPGAALTAVTWCLERNPEDAKAHELHAQALQALGRQQDALAAFAARAVLQPAPQPQFYLDRLALQRELDHPSATQLAGLAEGLARLGPLLVLEEAALATELRAVDRAGALARLDRLIAAAVRPEPWLLQRGDLLRDLGRPHEALASYQAALAAIARLPPARRETAATSQLAAQVLARIEQRSDISQE